jgi:hypothetical protein
MGRSLANVRERCMSFATHGRDKHAVVDIVILTAQLIAYRSPIVVSSADSRANSDSLKGGAKRVGKKKRKRRK